MLAGNRLTSLPLSLSECTYLELLRIAANRLQLLPDWLLTLPRLSWLASPATPSATPTRPRALHATLAAGNCSGASHPA